MSTSIKRVRKFSEKDNILLLTDNKSQLNALELPSTDISYLKKQFKNKNHLVIFNSPQRLVMVAQVELDKKAHRSAEYFRLLGHKASKVANEYGLTTINIQNYSSVENAALLASEGMALGNYQFLKYKKEAKEEAHSLKTIQVLVSQTDKKATDFLQNNIEAVYHARTLVNEPLMFLTATQMSEEFKKMGKEAGFKTKVFDKKRIIKENMQGLLAVNLGSPDPPTFSIMEWKPKNAKNKKPIVLVGKGVVYDTGGLSLKPTANSMDFMKCDMGGAAAVGGIMYGVAKNKLPLHVIGLVPATDNRPGLNAYVPGDVIRMRDGLSVEVLNTDAEGRMILADALSYAKDYDPQLVIDFATLTGASARSVGPHAIAMMSKADRKTTEQLIESGYQTFERMVEFPLWEEYGEMLKSDIADIKNLGGAFSGGITAGKFLEHFTSYPWIHLDIAGTAWTHRPDAYRGKNGTGSGVRLILDFLQSFI